MATRSYQLSWNFNVKGQFATNIYHWQFDDGVYATTQAAALALINAWHARDLTNMRSILPTGVTFLSMKSRLVGSVGGFEAVKLIAAATAGTRAGDLQCAATGPTIIHYPGNNGTVRGKTFLPGISISDCADGEITASFLGVLTAVIGTLYDPLTLVGTGSPVATFGTVNRVSGNFTALPEHRVSPVIGTQRRRQRPA